MKDKNVYSLQSKATKDFAAPTPDIEPTTKLKVQQLWVNLPSAFLARTWADLKESPRRSSRDLPHAKLLATNIGRVRHYLQLLTAERENEREDPTTCLPLGGAAGNYEGVSKTQPISLPTESSRLRRGYGRWYKCTWRCTSDPVQEEPHYESTDSDSKTLEHNSHQAVMVEPPALQEGCWNHAGPP